MLGFFGRCAFETWAALPMRQGASEVDDPLELLLCVDSTRRGVRECVDVDTRRGRSAHGTIFFQLVESLLAGGSGGLSSVGLFVFFLRRTFRIRVDPLDDEDRRADDKDDPEDV